MLNLSLEPETQEVKIANAMKKIDDAITNIESNEEWKRYLLFQSKFHNYSFSNTMFIFAQKPDASYVAGYTKWRSLDRFVRKGERAIDILAPIIKKREYTEMNDSKKTKEDNDFVVVGFRVVGIFDISQTDGSDENLPILVTGLPEEFEDSLFLYEWLKGVFTGVTITEIDKMSAKGSYNKKTCEIKVKSTLSTAQKCKTLIHEYSHFLHHTKYFNDEVYSLGEIIAESSAFIVADFLGLDTKKYSIPYVQSWSGGDMKKIKQVGTKTQKISAEIIQLIETRKALEQKENAQVL
jgi:hypothetical protein